MSCVGTAHRAAHCKRGAPFLGGGTWHGAPSILLRAGRLSPRRRGSSRPSRRRRCCCRLGGLLAVSAVEGARRRGAHRCCAVEGCVAERSWSRRAAGAATPPRLVRNFCTQSRRLGLGHSGAYLSAHQRRLALRRRLARGGLSRRLACGCCYQQLGLLPAPSPNAPAWPRWPTLGGSFSAARSRRALGCSPLAVDRRPPSPGSPWPSSRWRAAGMRGPPHGQIVGWSTYLTRRVGRGDCCCSLHEPPRTPGGSAEAARANAARPLPFAPLPPRSLAVRRRLASPWAIHCHTTCAVLCPRQREHCPGCLWKRPRRARNHR